MRRWQRWRWSSRWSALFREVGSSEWKDLRERRLSTIGSKLFSVIPSRTVSNQFQHVRTSLAWTQARGICHKLRGSQSHLRGWGSRPRHWLVVLAGIDLHGTAQSSQKGGAALCGPRGSTYGSRFAETGTLFVGAQLEKIPYQEVLRIVIFP